MIQLPGTTLWLTPGDQAILVNWLASLIVGAVAAATHNEVPVPQSARGTPPAGGPSGGAENPDDDWKNKLRKGLWVVGGFLVVAAAAWYFWPTGGGGDPPVPPSPPAAGGVDPLAHELHDLTTKLFGADQAIGVPRPPRTGMTLPPTVLIPPVVTAVGATAEATAAWQLLADTVAEVAAFWRDPPNRPANQEFFDFLAAGNPDVDAVLVRQGPALIAQLGDFGWHPSTVVPPEYARLAWARVARVAESFHLGGNWRAPLVAALADHLDGGHAAFLARAEAEYARALVGRLEEWARTEVADFLRDQTNAGIPAGMMDWAVEFERSEEVMRRVGIPTPLLQAANFDLIRDVRDRPRILVEAMVERVRHGMDLTTPLGRYEAYTWYIESVFDRIPYFDSDRNPGNLRTPRLVALLGSNTRAEPVWSAHSEWLQADYLARAGEANREQSAWFDRRLELVHRRFSRRPGTFQIEALRLAGQHREMDLIYRVYQEYYGGLLAEVETDFARLDAWRRVIPSVDHQAEQMHRLIRRWQRSGASGLLENPVLGLTPAEFNRVVNLWRATERLTETTLADVAALEGAGGFTRPEQYAARAYDRLVRVGEEQRFILDTVHALRNRRVPGWLNLALAEVDWVPGFVSGIDHAETAARYVDTPRGAELVRAVNEGLQNDPMFYRDAAAHAFGQFARVDRVEFERSMTEWMVQTRLEGMIAFVDNGGG